MSRWFRRGDAADRGDAAGDGGGGDGGGEERGVERSLPAIDSSELINDWIRTLTLLGEGHGPEETLALIAQVNQPGKHTVAIRTPLPAEDVRALEESLAWQHEIRSRQAGVNILVEQFLIRWLADATGQSWSEIVQRLAREIAAVTPPE